MKLTWPQLLSGLRPKKIQQDINTVRIRTLGDCEIGPYDQLLKFVKETDRYVLPVEVHHIVNGEHLGGTGWEYRTAPCVVLGKTMHQQFHGRFSETLPEYHSRRNVGSISSQHVLQLYHDIFSEQTHWTELWTIAARVLTGKVSVPSVKAIWQGEA